MNWVKLNEFTSKECLSVGYPTIGLLAERLADEVNSGAADIWNDGRAVQMHLL